MLAEINASDGQIITFIDELHTVVGAGADGDSSMDAGNMLKPMLARGELRMVGATTLDEYRERIEKDPALERRFQQVFVGEPSVEDTIAILRGLKERYEVAPRRPHRRRRAGRGRDPVRPLHHRALPARQGHRPRRRGGVAAAHGDRLPAGRDRRAASAPSTGCEMEEMALAKETDEASRARLEKLRSDLADRQEELERAQRPLGAREGRHQRDRRASRSSSTSCAARPSGPSATATSTASRELRYGEHPRAGAAARRGGGRRTPGAGRRRHDGEGGGRPRRRRRGRVDVDRHPRRPAARGRDRQAAAHGGRARQAADRPGVRRTRRVRRRTPGARRHLRPRPADRLVPVPRPDRRRQDRAGQGARRLPVRRRARDGAHRHERVRREALRRPARRRPSRLRRLRGGRPAHRGGAPPPVLAWSCSTRSRRRTRRSSTSCCRCSTTGGSPTARAAPSTSATRS